MPVAPTDAAPHAYASIDRFAIGFDGRDRARLHALWDEVIDGGQWSHASSTAAWSRPGRHGTAPARRDSSWAGGALAALDFAGVAGEAVLCPSNTFMATPLRDQRAGGRRSSSTATARTSACRFEDFERKAEQHQPRPRCSSTSAATSPSTSSGSPRTAASNGIFLIEDCAHAHGAAWNGAARAPGATPASTRSTRRRRSRPARAACWSRATRSCSTSPARSATTASPTMRSPGLNFRISEFTAAIGLVQTERLEEIVAWKNRVARDCSIPRTPTGCELPDGMVSGLYKYIVFDRSSARPAGSTTSPATASWAPATSCPTPTGSPRTTGACRCTTGRRPRTERDAVRVLVTGGSGFIGSHVVDQLLARGPRGRATTTCAASPYHAPARSRR